MDGVLLVNTGSPDSPAIPDVRRYLNEFLMDERVLDYPPVLHRLIVRGLILPRRPATSAAAYRSIWWDEGSPLVVISRRVQKLLKEELGLPVELGMRYRLPTLTEGVSKLVDQGVNHILLAPLFPHYAMSTVESIVAATREIVDGLRSPPELTILPPFYNHPAYIEALVASAAVNLGMGYDHLLFSYHGLPERHLRKTDPTGSHCLAGPDCCETPSPAHALCYRHQVLFTTRRFVQAAGIAEGAYSVAFQSRLGRDRWLQPNTAEVITQLATSGIRRLLVICPAFVADCLETLEEIGMGGHDRFLAAGGEEYRLVPCLNDNPTWIQVLAMLCRQALLAV